MKITILGAGNVGVTLGKRFVEAGHTIRYGVPDPTKYDAQELGGQVGTVAASTAMAELILLALPFSAVEEALRQCGDLSGKILVDATNPLGMTEGQLALTIGHTASGAEYIATLAPQARVVKCFNQTGFGNMQQPNQSVMFVCGNDVAATETVRQLAADIGFDAISSGDLSKARLLEPLALLWIHLSRTTSLGRDFAFHLHRPLSHPKK